jgi:hypothetical protein
VALLRIPISPSLASARSSPWRSARTRRLAQRRPAHRGPFLAAGGGGSSLPCSGSSSLPCSGGPLPCGEDLRVARIRSLRNPRCLIRLQVRRKNPVTNALPPLSGPGGASLANKGSRSSVSHLRASSSPNYLCTPDHEAEARFLLLSQICKCAMRFSLK